MRYGRTKTWIILLAVLGMVLYASLASAELPKNVILMISDGMGYNTIKATDCWTGTTSVYESFTTQFSVSTFSAGTPTTPSWGYDPAQAWSDFSYVKQRPTDSASAATAIATGVKNYDGQINWSTTGQPLTNIVQIAGAQNKATGVVTSVQWSHATPAAMAAHNVSRNNYSAIANEMLGSNLNVIMGAGNPNFNDSGGAATTPNYTYVGGSATWNALNTGTLNGWTSIQAKSDFEALAATTNPALLPDKVVGTVQAATTTQQSRSGLPADSNNPSGMAFNTSVPSLATMSKAALNVLNQNSNGFFLMVEGGAVDWASHANQLGRAIEEQMDFNTSVQAVVDWVNANSNWNDTLLIVTADHETGDLWGPTPGTFNEVVNHGIGVLAGAAYNSGDHTNELIPLFAIGAGSELFAGYADQSDPDLAFYGLSNYKYLDNTEIFQVMNGNTVPLPAAVWLLGSGLVGLGFLRRKQDSDLN